MIAGPGGDVPAMGDLAIVCSRSGGSRRPPVCGKSPKDLAFAVHLWSRGRQRFPSRLYPLFRSGSGYAASRYVRMAPTSSMSRAVPISRQSLPL